MLNFSACWSNISVRDIKYLSMRESLVTPLDFGGKRLFYPPLREKTEFRGKSGQNEASIDSLH